MTENTSTTPGVTIHGVPGLDGLSFSYASGFKKQLANAARKSYQDGKIVISTGNETYHEGEVTLVIRGDVPADPSALSEVSDWFTRCEEQGFADNLVDATVEKQQGAVAYTDVHPVGLVVSDDDANDPSPQTFELTLRAKTARQE